MVCIDSSAAANYSIDFKPLGSIWHIQSSIADEGARRLSSLFIVGCAISALLSLVREWWVEWRYGKDRFRLAMLAVTLASIAVLGGISHSFSSLYLINALPFIVFGLNCRIHVDKWLLLRMMGGVAAGNLSLAAYLRT